MITRLSIVGGAFGILRTGGPYSRCCRRVTTGGHRAGRGLSTPWCGATFGGYLVIGAGRSRGETGRFGRDSAV